MSARLVLVLAGLLAFAPSSVQALEFKNIRPAYGLLGATRSDAKFLPGDFLLITYEIDGLKLDAKNHVVFTTLFEVFDSTTKVIYKKESPNLVFPQLGTTRVPGDLHVIMGKDKPAGKYTVRLTVMDQTSKEQKSFSHPFELLAPNFGVVALSAPTIAFPGHPYMLSFNLVEFGLDAAKKPKAKLEIKIFDEAGKPTPAPFIGNYPADLPDDVDLKKFNLVHVDYPIFPNRTGRFTVEITATDSISQKTAVVRYPLNVVDLAVIGGEVGKK